MFMDSLWTILPKDFRLAYSIVSFYSQPETKIEAGETNTLKF